ncbi:MAG TPA: OsmC family protein [Saprospiraceae bacterium]|nr:OsmC family protein [Saprospiraceae bacterium]
MKHEIESNWMGKMQFNALVQGHTIIMDAPERVGGENLGPIPKPFILSALSGCTGMDVVALLRKEGKALHDFSIKVSGEISKHPPIEYVAVHLEYNMKGNPEDMEAALNAVRISQGKICGISHMLKKIIPVTWTVFYNDQQVTTSEEVELLENAGSPN